MRCMLCTYARCSMCKVRRYYCTVLALGWVVVSDLHMPNLSRILRLPSSRKRALIGQFPRRSTVPRLCCTQTRSACTVGGCWTSGSRGLVQVMVVAASAGHVMSLVSSIGMHPQRLHRTFIRLLE
jgi:hypothetical protein